MKLFIWPDFGDKPDPGDGGVRRVVEAQRQLMPGHGWEIAASPEEADVLAAHITAPPQWFSGPLARKPMVAHNHGFYWSEFDWGGNWANRDNAEVMKLIKGADAVTAPSDWVRNIIRRHSSREAVTVYHGVPTPLAEPEPHDGYVLWNKTRVDPICDPTPVVEAALRLHDVEFRATTIGSLTGPENLRVIGKEPYEAALQTVARAGVYLCTTRETFGIGTLEALAAGVPVVGFSWGGQNEIVEHLKDGYLARPGDYDDLARGIVWALHHRDSLSKWARVKAESFSWHRPMQQYAEIYDAVIKARSTGPRVSIIVPCYNLARYLPEALTSVQTQSDADWECIVVDDASTDNTAEVALEFVTGDPRFTLISNAENQYLSEARNTGIRAARGRYILPLDADDYLAPNAVATLADDLDTHRDHGVAYAGVHFIQEDGTPENYGRGRSPGTSGWPMPFDIGLFMTKPGQPLPYSAMFKREAWRQTGGYRRRVKSSEDCDFWLRLASYGWTPHQVSAAPVLVYRNRKDGMSATAGWADVENKAWFPWVMNDNLLPAAGNPSTNNVPVAAYDPPFITVVIPVGPGHEQYCRDAVDSVDAQTFRHWECIVVNDTGGPLPELPAWVNIITTEGKVGVAKARNAGIMNARGLLFLPLDADDYLLPDALDAMFKTWRDGERNDVIYSDFWHTPQAPADRLEGETFQHYEAPDFTCTWVTQNALHAVTALTPMAVWRDVGGFDPDAPWEDWDFQFKYLTSGFCARRLAAPVWVYRKHTGERRLTQYNQRETGKAWMMERFGDYIEGRKPMAGCATCGGRTSFIATNTNRSLGVARMARVEGLADDQMVAIVYIGQALGTQSVRGDVTRKEYHFQKGRPRYVDKRDAAGFLGKPQTFAPGEGVTVMSSPANGGPPAPFLVAHTPPSPEERLAPAPIAELDEAETPEEIEDDLIGRPVASAPRIDDLPAPPPPPAREFPFVPSQRSESPADSGPPALPPDPEPQRVPLAPDGSEMPDHVGLPAPPPKPTAKKPTPQRGRPPNASRR